MDYMSTTGVSVDTSQGFQEIDKLDNAGKRSIASIAAGIRRTAQMGISLAQATGNALSVTNALLVESLLVSVEATLTIATAQSITAIGALKLGAAIAQVALMLALISRIKAGDQENVSEFNGAIMLLRQVSYCVLMGLYIILIIMKVNLNGR